MSKNNPVNCEVEKQAMKNALHYNMEDNMIKRDKRKLEREIVIQGAKGKYIKRRGQVDEQTVENSGYRNSLAYNKYILKGTRGYYHEKDVVFWHANID